MAEGDLCWAICENLGFAQATSLRFGELVSQLATRDDELAQALKMSATLKQVRGPTQTAVDRSV